MTPPDSTRVQWITDAINSAGLKALVCTLPENVLLLSGYWPVVGTAVAIATAEGRTAVLAPEDERDLAGAGRADEVRTYSPGSLSSLTGPSEAVREPLAALLRDLSIVEGELGYDDAPLYEESTYAAMYLFRGSIRAILAQTAPRANIRPAGRTIMPLRSRLTEVEVGQVRTACRIAGDAFEQAASAIQPGAREPEVAVAFAGPMSIEGLAQVGVQRAGAFTWCMSGPNSALAGAAYARTRNRELQEGDFVLVHCNSYVDGFWTDITRTYCLGAPDERKRAMYDAVLAAREAALSVLRPGVMARDVDSAARNVLEQRGFGQYFTHGLGHNVGFSAISAEFPPRLHPASPDRMEVGMTFNVEPSIYIHSYGGLRHCDVVTLHDDGPEVLTPFGAGIEEATRP